MPESSDIDPRSGVLVTTPSGPDGLTIVWASPGFELLTGYGVAEVLGRSPSLLQGPDTDPRTAAALHAAIATGTDLSATILNYRADGTPFWNELTIAPRRTGSGAAARIVEWVGALHDVTDQMARGVRLHRLERYDQPTGLPNDAALHDEMRSALHRARVHECELALLLIDIEDLPAIRHRIGRHEAVPLQRELADRLRALVRPGDTLARIDDDEFALLVADVPREAGNVGAELATRLLTSLREPFDVGGHRLELPATIGISVFPGAMSAAELLTQAGMAIELARETGRHVERFVPRSPDDEFGADAAFTPGSYGAEVAGVLERGAVTAALAPIVTLDGHDVVAYEALARGPEGSALHRPELLRRAAASAGLLEAFDRAGHAAGLAAAAAAGLPPGAVLFLNVIPATLAAPAEADAVASSDYEIVADVSADDLLAQPTRVLRAAGPWQRAGGRIALDDVGPDPRLLGLLPLLDPDVVKLDLARIQTQAPSDRARLATAVAALRDRTGATLLAEWIETADDELDAATLGADVGGGLLYGVPGTDADPPARALPLRPTPVPPPDDATPLSLIGDAGRNRVLSAPGVERTMALAEQRALGVDGVVLLAIVPDAAVVDPDRAARLRALARRSALVALIGPGAGEQTIPGVLCIELAAGDALDGQWATIVLGAGLALAVAALPDGGGEPGASRFTLASCADPALVAVAARSLLPRLPDDVAPRP